MNLPLPNVWEIHPMLVHFPIAFLLAGVALDLVSLRWPREPLTAAAAGLLIAGVVFGWLAAVAGLLAFFTVPAHTEEAHTWMYWHLGLAALTLISFTWLAVVRWRGRQRPAMPSHRVAVVAGALLLMTGYLGGAIVYHGGAGVRPELLAPELRGGHADHAKESGKQHEHYPQQGQPEKPF